MIFLALTILSVLVAMYVGDKRQIGQGWSFFFCMTFSVVIGLIISILSSSSAPLKVSKSNKGMRVLFIILGSLLFFGFLAALTKPDFTQLQCVAILLPAIGFFGAAIYLSNYRNVL